MNKKIYLVTIIAIIVTTLSQTFSIIENDHQFYQTVQDKCTKCHGDVKIQLSSSANHTSYQCPICHVKSATNHTNTNPRCQNCHNARLNDTSESHTEFQALGSEGCIACHTTYNVLVNFSRPEYIEYTISDNNGNWVISNFMTSGTINLAYNAQRQGGNHNLKNVSCKDCHKDIFDAVSAGGHAVVLGKDGKEVQRHSTASYTTEGWCRTCHSRNDTTFPTQPHTVRKTTCDECHEAYGSGHPGNLFTNIKTVPHLYRSLVCISCKSKGWPAPATALHFKVRQEPYYDVVMDSAVLSIVSSSPAADPTTPVGTSQTFSITLNRGAQITWYNGNSEVFTVVNAISSSYTKTPSEVGIYNISARATDGIETVSRYWSWNVTNTGNGSGGGAGGGGGGSGGSTSNSISGFVFDNFGKVLPGVLVQNGSNNASTSSSGYYSITNIPNGVYNFSYSKAGFDTGYFEFTFNGVDIVNANKTIYDTTPPVSVSNPNTSAGNFFINNSWVNPMDPDFNHTLFRDINGTAFANVTNGTQYLNLSLPPHFVQNISAQTVDIYGNDNLTLIWFNATVPNNVPIQSAIGNKTVAENLTLEFTVSAADADGDQITFGTNATNGTFNTTTGNFSWTPTYTESGTYVWNFNSSDGYGGVADETITVTVLDTSLSIISSTPLNDPTSIRDTPQNFNISLNRTANVTWYINGTKVQENTSIISADHTNSTADAGVWNVTAVASDGIDIASRTWNWTVTVPSPVNSVPPDPFNLSNMTGNFWVNHTWQPGIGNVTDSYNVSVNGTWNNGTINPFANTTTLPHGWVNITVLAYNSSGTGSLGAGSIIQNTQILNNPPLQTPIGARTVNEGELLTILSSATDPDNDAITHGTNATKGIFNTTTGNFSWQTNYSDSGTYVWYFNSTDVYGGMANENVTITVINIPLSLTSFSPISDPSTTQGTAQNFNVTMNRTSNVTWYMNGTVVQANSSVTSADYSNSSAGAGLWNVTAIAADGIDTTSRTWNWTVI